jgi:hypothetical protein
MAWWAWLLVGWVVAAFVVALLLGAAAGVIKRRERAGSPDAFEPSADGSGRRTLPVPRHPEVSEEWREVPRR